MFANLSKGNILYGLDRRDKIKWFTASVEKVIPTYGKTALELGLGIFLKKDLSNIDECLSQMDELMNNPKKYNELRNRIFDAFKANCDAKAIANKLIDDCFKD